jgi:hypothetical protein
MKVLLIALVALTGCAGTSFPDGKECPTGERCESSYNQSLCQGSNSTLVTCVDACHRGTFSYCQTTREFRDRSR